MKANHNAHDGTPPLVPLLRISVFQRMKANHNSHLFTSSIATVVTNLSIVFQRMKANHNGKAIDQEAKEVVTNLSISKNESKSQRHHGIYKVCRCCYESQYFKE